MLTLEQKIELRQELNTQDIDIERDEIFSADSYDSDDISVENTSTHQRRIYTSTQDPWVGSLYEQYQEGSLVLDPEFQRGYVWDTKKASRLIESALLNIPLPFIYLSEEYDGKLSVIDGQQRLTSFFSFLVGKFPDGREFRLAGLTPEYSLYERKLFKDLDKEIQNKIRRYPIKAITIQKDSDSELKFDIFERLNSGAVSLNEQELRNCVFRGRYNSLLKELSQDLNFRYLLGLERPEKRMKDIQLVLRFAAFFHSTYLNYKAPMKSFLNKDMERFRVISNSDADELRRAFKNSLAIIKSLFDKQSFKRMYKGKTGKQDGYWESKQINESLYDVLMCVFAHTDKNLAYRHLDSLREGLIELMTSDDEFITAIEKSTSSLQNVKLRFSKVIHLTDAILGNSKKEPRCFSLALKEELYKHNPSCCICGQRISSIDDAAIDHVHQYWSGGQTIPENARLVHRFCNWARSRNDIPLPKSVPIVRNAMDRGPFKKNILVEIDNEIFECDFDRQLLEITAEWLIKQGKLTRDDCPIHFGRSRTLISTEPIHERMNKHFFEPKQLSNDLWIELNYNSEKCQEYPERLLTAFGYDSSILTIERYS